MYFKNIFYYCVVLSSYAHSINLKFIKIEERLSKGEIIKSIPMREFLKQKNQICEFNSNKIFYIELKDGLKAVFRPFEDQDRNREGEIFAYRFSQWLDLDIVPPVVYRTINGKEGILQQYISPSIDLNKDSTCHKALSNITPKELSNMKVLLFVIGQWDAGPHNMLLHKKKSGKWCPWLFDFETIANQQKVRYGEFPFVKISNINEKGPTDFDFSGKIFNPRIDQNKPEFQKYLKINLLKKALNRNKTKKSYFVWNNKFYLRYYRFLYPDCGYTPSFTETYDLKTVDKLKSLDQKTLDSLIKDLKAPFFTHTDWKHKPHSIWKSGVLERTKQLLEHAQNKGKFF